MEVEEEMDSQLMSSTESLEASSRTAFESATAAVTACAKMEGELQAQISAITEARLCRIHYIVGSQVCNSASSHLSRIQDMVASTALHREVFSLDRLRGSTKRVQRQLVAAREALEHLRVDCSLARSPGYTPGQQVHPPSPRPTAGLSSPRDASNASILSGGSAVDVELYHARNGEVVSAVQALSLAVAGLEATLHSERSRSAAYHRAASEVREREGSPERAPTQRALFLRTAPTPAVRGSSSARAQGAKAAGTPAPVQPRSVAASRSRTPTLSPAASRHLATTQLATMTDSRTPAATHTHRIGAADAVRGSSTTSLRSLMSRMQQKREALESQLQLQEHTGDLSAIGVQGLSKFLSTLSVPVPHDDGRGDSPSGERDGRHLVSTEASSDDGASPGESHGAIYEFPNPSRDHVHETVYSRMEEHKHAPTAFSSPVHASAWAAPALMTGTAKLDSTRGNRNPAFLTTKAASRAVVQSSRPVAVSRPASVSPTRPTSPSPSPQRALPPPRLITSFNRAAPAPAPAPAQTESEGKGFFATVSQSQKQKPAFGGWLRAHSSSPPQPTYLASASAAAAAAHRPRSRVHERGTGAGAAPVGSSTSAEAGHLPPHAPHSAIARLAAPRTLGRTDVTSGDSLVSASLSWRWGLRSPTDAT